jgi:hypothetical protein
VNQEANPLGIQGLEIQQTHHPQESLEDWSGQEVMESRQNCEQPEGMQVEECEEQVVMVEWKG